jgi:hypothetical protein
LENYEKICCKDTSLNLGLNSDYSHHLHQKERREL